MLVGKGQEYGNLSVDVHNGDHMFIPAKSWESLPAEGRTKLASFCKGSFRLYATTDKRTKAASVNQVEIKDVVHTQG